MNFVYHSEILCNIFRWIWSQTEIIHACHIHTWWFLFYVIFRSSHY